MLPGAQAATASGADGVTPAWRSLRPLSPPARAVLERREDLAQCAGHHRQVAVVHGAAVELPAELAQGVTPFGMAGDLHSGGRYGDDDRSLDDLDGCLFNR